MTYREYWGKLKRNPFFYLLILEIVYFVICEITHGVVHSKRPPHFMAMHEFSTNYSIANSCLGGAVLTLMLAPYSKITRRIILVLGIGIETWRWFNGAPDNTWLAKLCLVGPGVFALTTVTLLFYLIRDFWRHSSEAIRTLEVLTLSTAIAVLYVAYLPGDQEPTPVYDSMLMAAEGTLGFHPSFTISAALFSSHWVTSLMIFVYGYLPTWLLISQAIIYRKTESEENYSSAFIPAAAYLVTTLLGIAAYDFFPAIGTEAFCGTATFPFGPVPELTGIPKSVLAPPSLIRNAMPSLHLSLIICALMPLFDIDWRWWTLYIFLTIGTLLSAFQIGHHWLFDFVVALPFVAACIGIVATRQNSNLRLAVISLSAVASLVIMAILKYDIQYVLRNHATFWSIVIAVDIISCIFLALLVSPRFTKTSKP